MEGEREQEKRRRIATACRTCQQKKTKCDGKRPCSYCTAHGTECQFPQSRTRGHTRKGSKYINTLEARLVTMESLLEGSGLLSENSKQSKTPTIPDASADTTMSGIHVATTLPTSMPIIMTPPDSNYHQLPIIDDSRSQDSFHTSPGNSDQSRSLERDRDREEAMSSLSWGIDYSMESLDSNSKTVYPGIGPAGFSIFSPKGIQWVMDKTGNTAFQDAMIAATKDDNTRDFWTSDTFSCVFNRRVFRPLPPKQETVLIVKRYFKDFNCACPLFSQPLFMSLLERHYTSDPCDSVGWWASLNVVIAITLTMQALNNAPPSVAEMSRDYLRNSLAVLTELTIRSTDLFGVQALLGMALLMQGTPDPRPGAFLIASAMRFSHTLGLHRKESSYGFDPIEAEQRRRVFWIAYRLDKDLCIRSGLPLVQDDDDMNLDLPSGDPPDKLGNISLPDAEGKLNIFRVMADFATIQAKVHRRLYSANVLKQSDEKLLFTISELDHQLEEWKESIPFDLEQPQYKIRMAQAPQGLHLIVLHFSYYNCLHTIHRTSINHSYWTRRPNSAHDFETVPPNPQVFQSAALCSSSARASIRLIRYIPSQDIGFVWRVLYFPVSAFITLFAGVLQTPTDSRVRSDLRLMKSFVEFLSALHHESSPELKRILRVCSEFEKTARDVVERVAKNKQQSKDQKRTNFHDLNAEKQGLNSHHNVSLDAMSATINSRLGFNSPPLYGRLANQSFQSSLDIPQGQPSQEFSGFMGEVRPMFPDGLTMPWNGNTFHGSFVSDPATSSYGFGGGMSA